jgi:nicotinamidase-related amidase
MTARAPWLVVIDMQRVFAEPDGAWAVPRFAEIVPAVKNLVAAYRPRTVFTRFVAPEVPAGAWAAYYERWPFALRPPDDPMYGLVDALHDLGAADAEPTVDATTFGKWTPELAARIGDGPLVLAGVSTDCCVLSTALAAADAGVEVRVVADACAGVDDQSHARALDVLRLYEPLVRVVDAAEAAEWGAWVA